MSSFWESKYLSSEKSVQFLQQTHAEILKGLHDEIDNLQKTCSDYALKLSMRAATEVEKEEFDKKFRSFNVEYKKKDALIQDQQNLINERNKNIKSLTERIKSMEKRLEQEASPKDLTIKQLKKELELKSTQIANLSYQLHNANKSNKQHHATTDPKESLAYINTSINNESMKSPGRSKKVSHRHKNRDQQAQEEAVFENTSLLNHTSKTSISNIKERRMSAESLLIDTDLNDNNLKSHANSLKSFTQQNQRLTQSVSSTNSAVSDRSEAGQLNDLRNKLLPPVAVVKRSLDANVPDPKPFLQSMSSTLHSRSKKELLQRRALIALPQIKPYETAMIQQLAVESPIKSLSHHGQHVENNNNSAN